ncbi:E3 ubiquitin-protein ligase TM129 [Hondaea fermentalgiana]|uniref:E3 ubiquitin-protein ligase TM129 n=1 Tax=Hondaea fermentalgiana TaxID=2315210 RepID=A0A2R5GR86_9STRA|nr:E3 ubiquitin-protein ligase TM129 [Hondaea fermentalgiana]|eukprot:GBG30861.1 E3 ubiquitin-protein ligase TM129 [Hondaea fermentalgiana]
MMGRQDLDEVLTLDDRLDLVQQATMLFVGVSLVTFYVSGYIAALQHRWSSRSVPPLHVPLAGARQNSERDGQIEGATRGEEEVEDNAQRASQRRVTSVIVRAGALVDGVTFVYSDVPEGVTFGGTGGTEFPPFELEDDEYIVEVRGQQGAYLDQIQFVTNRGRMSPAYGGSGGQYFALDLGGAPIGGIFAQLSINGWIRCLQGVIELHKVRVEPPRTAAENARALGLVRAHRDLVRRRLSGVYIFGLLYALLVLSIMGPFLWDVVRGPAPLDVSMRDRPSAKTYVLLPAMVASPTWSTGPIKGREHRAHFIAQSVDLADDPRGPTQVLVKVPGTQDGAFPGFSSELKSPCGIVRRVEKTTKELSSAALASAGKGARQRSTMWLWTSDQKDRKPAFYVDQTFSPASVYLCAAALSATAAYLLYRGALLFRGFDPVALRLAAAHGPEALHDGIIAEMDREILDPSTLVLAWNARIVVVTPNWLICTSYFGLDVVAIEDARVADLQVSGRWIKGELVEIVTMRIESRSSILGVGAERARAMYAFDVSLPRGQFETLRSTFVESVRKREEIVVSRREANFHTRFNEMLCESALQGRSFRRDEFNLAQECLGACGNAPNVLIRKSCDTCEERADCPCEPAWCETCLIKWWFARNRTRMELVMRDDEVDPSWQGQCPTCRVYFCLHDVIPRADIKELLESCAEDASSAVSETVDYGHNEVEAEAEPDAQNNSNVQVDEPVTPENSAEDADVSDDGSSASKDCAADTLVDDARPDESSRGDESTIEARRARFAAAAELRRRL